MTIFSPAKKVPARIMAYKRPKIKYAPRHWHGVFPAMVILFTTLAVGAGLYSAPSIYGFVAYNGMFSYLSDVANAQQVYHAEHDTYTKDTGLLVTSDKTQVQAPAGTTGKIIAACQDGWVAYAEASVGRQALYASSVSPMPQLLSSLKLPGCVTSDELSGTTLNYAVKVTDVTVTRSTKTGATVEGATSPKKARESATVKWEATNSCSKGQIPTYRVRVLRQDLTDRKIAASSKTPRDYTTIKTSLDVSSILNGITYQVQVSGKCGANYPYGTNDSAKFTQKLPTPKGITGHWESRTSRLNTMYGRVSTSGYVHYQLQVQKYGAGTWRTIVTDMNPDKAYYTFTSYSAAGGDTYRIRAYTVDGAVYSNWSNARGVKFVYSY